MISTSKYLVLLTCLLAFQPLFAQAEDPDPVKDADNEFNPSTDEEINFRLTRSVISSVDWIQYRIEKDSVLSSQAKIKYLRGLESVLKFFNNNWRRGNVHPTQLPMIIGEYEKCMRADAANESIDHIISLQPYEVGRNLINAGVFDKNQGYKNSQYILIKKYCALHPDQVLLKLRDNTDLPFLDSLITVAGYRNPGQLYDFAAANNKLGFVIRKINDPLISTISKMATSNSGRWYFPFLDDIMKGKMSIGEIDAAKDDSVGYYRLLVRTRLNYVQRALNRDTAYGYRDLEKRIVTKARDIFVNTINSLHEVDDPKIRFKIIQPLTAEELFYLAVTTDGIIYTSSFVKGVYPLMMARANQHGDSLLMNVKLKANYERNLTGNNKRGVVMYNLLHKLFLSADTNNHIDLSKEFGIPPVYGVPFKALSNDTGRVVMQVFFYGDKDGLGIFQGFKRLFDSKLWKITTTQNWIAINSIKGRPVSIYANLPLPEEDDLDKKAQDALDTFLLKNNLYPTVVIHRGHSYNAPYTIAQILPSAKIVFMGSCGGYYLIHDILKHSPDAHIITSKQIGKTAVNQPFFNLIMEKVRNGNNIDWIPFWEELEKKIKVEGFEDYIPPYKNLGAIFIKAYKKAMGDED